MDIVPSPEARLLFGQMVARADEDLILELAPTFKLAADRKHAGHRCDCTEVSELIEAGWIGAHSSGGWVLYEEVMRIEA
jgi:hypothetical protein